MATSYNADWAGDLAGVGAADATKGAIKPSLARRFYDALVQSRQRTAEREIEAYIARHGGVMTDEIERGISRNFGQAAGTFR